MTWTEVCADPNLQDLPYKIELNEYGQIVMSPASNDHGWNQMSLGIILAGKIPDGGLISECSIETRLGVKVADVAWLSAGFLEKYGRVTPYPQAPEICIEIASPSNSNLELVTKRSLYFEQGAREVWVVDAQGLIRFYNPAGEIETSQLIAEAPDRI